LLRNPDVFNDYDYVRIGFGFIKIATNSFYWYVVIVSGLAFTLLFRLRTTISRNYLATGFCLIYLVIGNSLYFFGRSHENNIINISIVLLLLFFLLIDLASRFLGNAPGEPAKRFMHRNLSIIISMVLIAAITVWYGDSITGKVSLQAQNAGKGQLVYPPWVSKQDVVSVIAQVKSITGDNPKVYFVGDGDFVLDYYGGYAPVGYFNPVYAWISMNEFKKFLQGLLDQGYYIVVDNAFAKEVLSSIHISKYRNIKGCVVAWK